MGSENEPAKLLLPYLQRADELHKHEPLVAYYCRLYAMERGLKFPSKERTETTNALLLSLMNQLEKDKKSLKLTREDNLYVEGFALKVFAKADKQDHSGRADLNTAKTFYAASIFFEILNQFGDLAQDLEQKQKYAAWKAADIRKALKEGRKPEAGPPGGNNDLSVPSNSTQPLHGLDRIKDFSENGAGAEDSFGQDMVYHQSPHVNTLGIPCHKADKLSHESQHLQMPPTPPSNMDKLEPVSPLSYHTSQQAYSTEQNNTSHDGSAFYNYSNFQSYPSFNESSIPPAPNHHSSYYQGTGDSYAGLRGSVYQHEPLPAVPNYNTARLSSSPRRDSFHPGGPTLTFNYDVNYRPTSEKIFEAHKAAKFAVGALAFDDVTTAVEHLRQSLELLTNPSAGE